MNEENNTNPEFEQSNPSIESENSQPTPPTPKQPFPTKLVAIIAAIGIIAIIGIVALLPQIKSSNNSQTPSTPSCMHQWIEADCLYPKTCRICQETSGTAKGHSYIEATCTEPKTCKNCNKIEGTALGHDWGNPTCTTPRSCCVCFEVDFNSKPLGHSYLKGVCSICGDEDPDYIAYGNVSGQLTYQYNKFVGTRGDNGATVMLIPRNDNVKNYDNNKAAMLFPDTYESGIIVVQCDGYGNFDFNNKVPSGEYFLVAISNNTTSGIRFDDEEFWEFLIDGSFGAMFSDEDKETLHTFIGYSDWTFEMITIEDGDSFKFTYDFGYTYI